MKKNYNQPEVSVTNVAMTSFICTSPGGIPSGDPNQIMLIGGGDPGDAI